MRLSDLFINIMKKENVEVISHTSQQSLETQLTAITLAGVVIPWSTLFADGTESQFKLVCRSGDEYFFAADESWSNVLRLYSWDEVKVVGLLNLSDRTIIPQKVIPRGPTGERERVIDLADRRKRLKLIRIAENIDDLVAAPAAMVMAN